MFQKWPQVSPEYQQFHWYGIKFCQETFLEKIIPIANRLGMLDLKYMLSVQKKQKQKKNYTTCFPGFRQMKFLPL